MGYGEEIEWVGVKHKLANKTIGAVGFLGDEVVTLVSFYSDEDGDFDGQVSMSETIASKLSVIGMGGTAAARVANAAAQQYDIRIRDANIGRLAGKLTVKMASGMVMNGVYAAYFKQGVSSASGMLARKLTTSSIKAFAIKKGLEKAVKDAMT